MGADVQASVGGDGQAARRLDAGRQASQRPGGFETQDSSRALLRDEERAVAVQGGAGGAHEPGSRTARRATRGQSIDDARPTVGDVARAVRGHGDADQLVAPVEDGLDGRERGDRLVGARRRRDRPEHGEDQEDGRARRPAGVHEEVGTRKNHAAPPDARNRRSQFGIRRSIAAGELRQLHKEPGRPPRRVGAPADLLFVCLLSGGLGRDWDEGGKTVMTRTQSLLTGVWLGAVVLAIAGCGAMQSTPDNPTGAGGLMPNVEDKDAGLVAVAPGFNISRYKVIVVEPFPVTDPTSKDEGDRQFAAKMAGFLQLELVRRLKASRLFPTVVNGSQTQYKPGAQPALRLQGAITRLGRGSQVARYFAGLYGAGRARAQGGMRFVEAASGRGGLGPARTRAP